MKQSIAVVVALLCLFSVSALCQGMVVPDGFTEHEAEIYKQGYEAGYYAAQHGVVEERHPDNDEGHYILNVKSRKFHYPSCNGVQSMNENNKEDFYGTRDEAIAAGYEPCGMCDP